MNSIKVFIIHGFRGSPNGGWRPDLMAGLEKHDIYACSLSMPNPEEPLLAEWLEEIDRHIERNKNDDIYLVGHSLGGTTILRYFENFEPINVKGIISVSAPCHKNENSRIGNFLQTDFNWKIIREKVSDIVVIHGDDDPNVPVSDAKEIADQLDGKLILISNGKHLNGSAGFTKLPEVCEALLNMIKK